MPYIAEAALWEMLSACGINPGFRHGIRAIIDALVADVGV